MKKVIAVVLSVFMLFCFASCELEYEYASSYGASSEVTAIFSSQEKAEEESSQVQTSSKQVSSQAEPSSKPESSSSTPSSSNTPSVSVETSSKSPSASVETSSKESAPTVTVPEQSETVGNLVWVPVNGGTKYHANSSCSKMKDPIQVSKETAISNGYEACKRCY